MKRILTFIISASMCLSLLTSLSPVFAYEDDSIDVTIEKTVELMSFDPEDEPERETVEDMYDIP